MKSFSVTVTSHNSFEVGKQIVDNLNSYTRLRDDYIHFFEKLAKEESLFDHEILIRFFEKPHQFKNPLEQRGSWSNWEFDNYRFIIHELFIYTVLIALKNESYKLLEELFNSEYIIKDRYQPLSGPKKFGIFYNPIDSFDSFYKQTFSKNFHSPMADFLIKRIPENLTKDQLVEADLLCHYIADFNNVRRFSLTYIYKNDDFSIDLFSRLISRRHFEKVKLLFNVTSVEELKKKFQDRKTSTNGNEFKGYSGSFESITPVYQLFDIEKIGSIR